MKQHPKGLLKGCPPDSKTHVKVIVHHTDTLPLGVQVNAICIHKDLTSRVGKAGEHIPEHVKCTCPSKNASDFLPSRHDVDVLSSSSPSGCTNVGHVYVDAISVKMGLFDQIQNAVQKHAIETETRELTRASWLVKTLTRNPTRAVGGLRLAVDLTSGAIGLAEVTFKNGESKVFDLPGHIMFAVNVANRAVNWPVDWDYISFDFCGGIKSHKGGEESVALTILKKCQSIAVALLQSPLAQKIILNNLSSLVLRAPSFARAPAALVVPLEASRDWLYSVFSKIEPLLAQSPTHLLNDEGLRAGFMTMSLSAAISVAGIVRKSRLPGRTGREKVLDLAFLIVLLSQVLTVGSVWMHGFGPDLSQYISASLAAAASQHGPALASWVLSFGNMAYMLLSVWDIIMMICGVFSPRTRLESFLKQFLIIASIQLPAHLQVSQVLAAAVGAYSYIDELLKSQNWHFPKPLEITENVKYLMQVRIEQALSDAQRIHAGGKGGTGGAATVATAEVPSSNLNFLIHHAEQHTAAASLPASTRALLHRAKQFRDDLSKPDISSLQKRTLSVGAASTAKELENSLRISGLLTQQKSPQAIKQTSISFHDQAASSLCASVNGFIALGSIHERISGDRHLRQSVQEHKQIFATPLAHAALKRKVSEHSSSHHPLPTHTDVEMGSGSEDDGVPAYFKNYFDNLEKREKRRRASSETQKIPKERRTSKSPKRRRKLK